MKERSLEDWAAHLELKPSDLRDIEASLGRLPSYAELVLFASSWSLRFFLLESGYYQQSFPNEGRNIVSQGRYRFLQVAPDVYCTVAVSANNPLVQMHGQHGAALLTAEVNRKLLERGVRPIGSMTALKYGETDRLSVQKEIDLSVKGIGGLLNDLGVPTIGGSVQFNSSYNQIPVQNSIGIGLQKGGGNKKKILDPAATSIILLSNLDLDESAVLALNPDLPIRIIPDVLSEKNLQEACLEIAESPALIDLFSVGCDGLGMALLQMASQYNLGFDLSLPELSELEAAQLLNLPTLSGMLVVLPTEALKQVKEIAQHWDVSCNVLGTFTEAKELKIFNRDSNIVFVTLKALDGAKRPVNLHNNNKRPAFVDKAIKFSYKKTSHSKDYIKIARRILNDENAKNNNWLWQQLDNSSQLVSMSEQTNEETHLMRLPDTNYLLLFTNTGNSEYLKADPYNGALIAVAEAARKITIAGGRPEAAVIGLNFGDATDGTVNWQLHHTLKAINEACRRFHTPVLDVDMSFGNQQISKRGALPILPTPIIGMIGTLENDKDYISNGFQEEGHLIYMIGTPQNDLNSSIYVKAIHSNPISMAPVLDLDEEYHIQQHFSKIVKRDLISSAQSVAEGGLFLALLKASLVNGYGFEVESDPNFRKDTYLFGEHQSRIVVTVKPEREDELINFLNAQNVPFTMLGEVTGDHLVFDDEDFGHLSEWSRLYNKKPY